MSSRGKYARVESEPAFADAADLEQESAASSNQLLLSFEPLSDDPATSNSSHHNQAQHLFDHAGDGPSGLHTFNEGTSSTLLSGGQDDATAPDLEDQATATPTRISTKQRVLNAVNHLIPFKQTYELLHNGLDPARRQALPTGRLVGQGTDGVFRNLTAKPETEATRATDEQFPPTYEEAATDSSPEYWEATMISPMYEDEVFVKGLPVGNLANFVWNILVTVAFQFVGFILCYLLHTSHAAKQGTRIGLGITLIMYGWSLVPANLGRPDLIPPRYQPNNPNQFDILKSLSIDSGGKVDTYLLGFIQNLNELSVESEAPYVAYGLVLFGAFVIIKSLVDFYLVKQEEKKMLAPQAEQATYSTTQDVDETPP